MDSDHGATLAGVSSNIFVFANLNFFVALNCRETHSSHYPQHYPHPSSQTRALNQPKLVMLQVLRVVKNEVPQGGNNMQACIEEAVKAYPDATDICIISDGDTR